MAVIIDLATAKRQQERLARKSHKQEGRWYVQSSISPGSRWIDIPGSENGFRDRADAVWLCRERRLPINGVARIAGHSIAIRIRKLRK